ncbi:hypothetical protein DEJ49_33350 [Streptomyces venezuelae]|uniref:Uncharacterized protein n=1 Tax=Streptomyces venezuelae TaxID=54571 RepID=A0A5P2CU12_STRVZ|nr:hypothetical protein [Streptomyces venezuelae]QES45228.1 hypothetical protein DEJ49_33350 [Streptomyces venezuelae]
MSDQTPGAFAAAVINDVRDNINAAPGVDDAAVFAAVCGAQAQLAIAAALLDVADAIRSKGKGKNKGDAIARAVDRMTDAVEEETWRREG